MSKSKEVRILNCKQDYFRGEYIPRMTIGDITPEMIGKRNNKLKDNVSREP